MIESIALPRNAGRSSSDDSKKPEVPHSIASRASFRFHDSSIRISQSVMKIEKNGSATASSEGGGGETHAAEAKRGAQGSAVVTPHVFRGE